ncbi:pantetheine-phosphate adenylyltransferase family protein, partial [Lepidopterella palustris CBS 459.81]
RTFTTMAPLSKDPHRCLLLLPPAPFPPTFAALKAAYGPSLFAVLRDLYRSPTRSQEACILDIALPCDHLYGNEGLPRSLLYSTTQTLVAGLYKLICVISAKDSIDVEDSEGIDPRVLLIAYPRNGKLNHSLDSRPEQDSQGPVIDIRTLASSNRPWQTIYSAECEEGEQILKNFLSVAKSNRNVRRVRGGIIQVSVKNDRTASATAADTIRRHRSVALGGTFDHLHIGHKLLLTMFAFVIEARCSTSDDSERCLTIGITGDELLKNKKFADFLESWNDRQRAVHVFMKSILDFGPSEDNRFKVEEKTEPGPNGHAIHVTFPSNLVIKYVEIWDPFGPTITDESISALVISAETRSGGKAVNAKRSEKSWSSLEIYEVDVLDAEEEDGNQPQGKEDETFQSKISSTEIRRMQSEK